jgi:hypothetical protein
MLSIQGVPGRLCDGRSRRDFLRVGSLGGLGLSLPRLLQAESGPATAPGFGSAKRCVLLFLTGGPPQLDTWDPKPDAPIGVRGELKPIATAVPGIRIGELFPRMARQADKFCIIRSVTHGDLVHNSAGYTMLTGVVHPSANNPLGAAAIRPMPNDHPHVGALLALVRAPRGGVPVFASLPESIKDACKGTLYPGQGGGFLGTSYDPFRIEGSPQTGAFRLPEIALPAGVTAERLADRRLLAERLDRTRRAIERREVWSGFDSFRARAFELILAPAVSRAFRLDREPERLRAAYGRHLFGQGCLLARRLLEAGVALVTVYWHTEGPDDSPYWDTHQSNFAHLRHRLAPPADQAVATLLEDLSARGLLAETLVICMGEFGRSPKINIKGGRDHWARVQSVILAGAGLRGGTIFGASDRLGAAPAEDPVTPPDLTATILHLLGVRSELEVHDLTNRPLRACSGMPIHDLIM